MSDPLQPSSQPTEVTKQTNVTSGANIDADAVNVSGDLVAHDKITNVSGDLVARDKVTVIGMPPEAVRRLVLTVGVLVFVTAACFFTGGVFLGAKAVAALGKPVDSNPIFGQQFQATIGQIIAQPEGTQFEWTWTEEQLSSYLRNFLGPRIGLNDARARILDDGQVIFYGKWNGFANLPVMAVVAVNTNSDRLFTLRSAAFRVFGDPKDQFGWIALPTSVLQPLVDQIDKDIGGNLKAVKVGSGSSAIVIDGVAQ